MARMSNKNLTIDSTCSVEYTYKTIMTFEFEELDKSKSYELEFGNQQYILI